MFAGCTNSSWLKASFTLEHDVLVLHFTKDFRKGPIFESTRSPILTLKCQDAWPFSTIAAGEALSPCINVLSFSSGTFASNQNALRPTCFPYSKIKKIVKLNET